ncbi:MAG: hypothetical protein V2A79_09070 [Planctomycetota bacterium]
MGYKRLDPQAFVTAQETVITGELVDAIRAVTEAPLGPRWVAHYECADDPPITTPGRQGKRRRRVDIAFVRTQHGPRPRFQMEAKRLHHGSSLDDYLGQDGLGRILSGAYAAQHPDAGMLGYVQDGKAADWANRLRQRLAGPEGECFVRENGAFDDVKLCPGLSYTYHSGHDRATLHRPVEVYHTLLPFC